MIITKVILQMATCKGQKNGGKLCGGSVDGESEYCEQHMYFKDYTEEMFENLTKCIRCANMHFTPFYI